jgi:hypoxanthine-DNA glycosylase
MTAATSRLVGLEPIISASTQVLILGSFPGVASLNAQQYYAHPRNQFWRVLSAVLNKDLYTMEYNDRINSIKAVSIGIWDVYASCERVGSLDAAIQNAQLNDFATLLARYPGVRAVAHNGGESARNRKHLAALGMAVHVLPSTSPANASWSFDRKLEAWRAALAPYLHATAKCSAMIAQ